MNSGLSQHLNQLADSLPSTAEALRPFTPTTRSYTFPRLTRSNLDQLRSQLQNTERKLNWLKMQLSNNNNEGDPIFSTGLNASGFSLNHDDLSESIKKLENATSQRREKPFLTSDMLGEDVLFSMK